MTTTVRHTRNDGIERTPITITAAPVLVRCHKCHKDVTPNEIRSAHAKPLRTCPRCHSLIQTTATQTMKQTRLFE